MDKGLSYPKEPESTNIDYLKDPVFYPFNDSTYCIRDYHINSSAPITIKVSYSNCDLFFRIFLTSTFCTF